MQAAHNSGIHYSTAKTILFFHKKKLKNYTTYIVNDPAFENLNKVFVRATWKDIALDETAKPMEKTNIQLIVNSKCDARFPPSKLHSFERN